MANTTSVADASIVVEAGASDAGVIDAGVDAGPPPTPGWSTRPEDGNDFFVAMDGDCEGLVLFPVHGGTFVHLGAWRGVARITADGLDLSYRDGVTAAEDKQGYGSGTWDWMAGTPDDLWAHTQPDGSVFRPSGLLRRTDKTWSAITTLGTDNVSYESVAPFQGGAIGVGTLVDRNEPGATKLYGVGGVNPTAIFPADASITNVRTLENGLVVAEDDGSVHHDSDAGFITENHVRPPRIFLLGPKDTRAHAAHVAAKKGDDISVYGYTSTTLRATVGKAAFVFDGEDFVAEPAGHQSAGITTTAGAGDIDATHANGSTDVRMERGAILLRDGTTYRPARLPTLPLSRPGKIKVVHVVVASDGEVFVALTRITRSRHGFDQTWTALLRQKRPREVLRCSERSMDYTMATADAVESWPPMLTDSCTTPFVIAATYPAGQSPSKTQPETVKTLKKHKELLPVTLVRVESSGRSIVGASVKTAADAKALADVLQKERGLWPDIVCAAPVDPEALVTVE